MENDTCLKPLRWSRSSVQCVIYAKWKWNSSSLHWQSKLMFVSQSLPFH